MVISEFLNITYINNNEGKKDMYIVILVFFYVSKNGIIIGIISKKIYRRLKWLVM